MNDLRTTIRDTLVQSRDSDFQKATRELLKAMNYHSDREGPPGADADSFIAQFPARNPNTATERGFAEEVKSVRVIFQITDSEIQQSEQGSLFETSEFYEGNARSFLFVAVELKGRSYPRGRYARFTREINKRFPSPTVVLFRNADNHVTLAFVHRRVNKVHSERDVLGSVSLVREIDTESPHRAHLNILADIALDNRLNWMDANAKSRNFEGLLAAWLDALDTEELNRRFYHDLFQWFNRAVEIARFPTKGNRVLPAEEHIIRLITRLMFVWFIKEKGLVANRLFVENQVRETLKDYDPDNGDSYYRAVLQNLFFATLNTEIDRRGFSKVDNSTHRDFSRYRYRAEMSDPDALLEFFRQTPFINGGLFDCLDSEEATGDGGYRIDCFTDNPNHRRDYSIPNRLFFGDDGLITLFNRYKFTVEENTPIEREVALDPELLGKVFENLLAAFNPETRDSVRKQTGSYYTPRDVVDYMVDEALVASLIQKMSSESKEKGWWDDRLRYLLNYDDAFDDADELFTTEEQEAIVRAIAETKILDPAIGSGAFPMGMLHKLTLALRRLDPDNTIWEALQKELAGNRASAAFDTTDQSERDTELQEISDTFEKYRESDFGRKLYLIQNSIYGVDIQPVATQIAKLRFFISLAIEQQPTDDRDSNYGIHPLPNLETRFVAANTLLALDRPAQMSLGQTDAVQKLQQALDRNRERHFHANTRRQKLDCRKEDARLRNELAGSLRKADFSVGDADKIAEWDPYEQNDNADWFDAEYMFGISKGFDVVIGNPPYIQLQKNQGELGKLYKDMGFATFAQTGDIYQLFYERGSQLLKDATGLLAYITSNSWLKAEYGKSLRKYFSERHRPLMLLELGKDVFDSAIVDSCVLLTRKAGDGESGSTFEAVDIDHLEPGDFPPDRNLWGQVRTDGQMPWSILSRTEQRVMDKMLAVGTPLKEWDIEIYRGITTGLNSAFIIDNQTKEELIAEDPGAAEIIKPVLRGRDIRRYQPNWAGLWLIDTHNGYGDVPAIQIRNYPSVKAHLDSFYDRLERRYDKGDTPYNLRNCAYHEDFTKEKLLWIELVDSGRFAYDDRGFYGEATTFLLTGESVKYLCAVLNSNLIGWFLRQVAPTSGMGTLRWKKVYVERLPLPRASETKQREFEGVFDSILSALVDNHTADVSEAENAVNRWVYELYGLTSAEISAVNGEFPSTTCR